MVKNLIFYNNILKDLEIDIIDNKNNDRITNKAHRIITERHIHKIPYLESKNTVKTNRDYYNSSKQILSTRSKDFTSEPRKNFQSLETIKHKTISNIRNEVNSIKSNEPEVKPFNNLEEKSRNLLKNHNSQSKLHTSQRDLNDNKSIAAFKNKRSLSTICINNKSTNKFILNSDRKNNTHFNNEHILFWKSTLSTHQYVYNSGTFNLPLMSKKIKIID